MLPAPRSGDQLCTFHVMVSVRVPKVPRLGRSGISGGGDGQQIRPAK
jgi:hypothetical protein